jgi:predicted RNA-binding protein YlqC (UPF0109 family)
MEDLVQLANERVVHLSCLLEGMVKFIVDQPEQVKINILDSEECPTLQLSVAPEDVRFLIGKQGRTARAMRVVLSAAGMKLKQRVSLDILE